MGKCKAKAVLAYSRIFGHNQTFSGIIRHIQELSRHIQAFSEPCVTPTYLEPCYIWIRGIFRTRSICRTLTYSEPCQISTMQHFAKIVNAYNYFHNISFSCSLLYEKNVNFYHAGLIFTTELFIWCKISMWPEGTSGCEFLISLFLISSKLAYLQITTVLTYGSSPLKSHEQNYLNC